VVIEATDHMADFSTYRAAQTARVLRAFQMRYLDLLNDPRFKYILIFKNFGKPAGASLEHCHCQLIATPTIPKTVTEEMENCLDYYNYRELRLLTSCRARLGARTVHEREVHRPRPASRFASRPGSCQGTRAISNMWPRQHRAADLLGTVLAKTLGRAQHPPYNFISTLPQVKGPSTTGTSRSSALTRVSGVEGTGFYINPVAPRRPRRSCARRRRPVPEPARSAAMVIIATSAASADRP
jgi:UDPglucose--hexose-1-phosphate uridylyltransferase